MAHVNKVLCSVNLPGENICVDIFQRPDGSFGFDQFRRDPEDGRGWYSISHFSNQRFNSEAHATRSARDQVPWLEALLS